MPTQAIITFGFFDLVNAVKITLPRPRAQGGIGETDMHAAQQHVPLQEIRVPWPVMTAHDRPPQPAGRRRGARPSPAAPRPQAWPSRPIKLVAPFAPGGGSDFTSRLVAEKLAARLGQTMLVENKPGAGGNLGAEAAIKAAADGYTYLTISGSYAINSILHKPSFDSLNDIVAIGQFTDEPTVLTRQSRGAGQDAEGAGRRSASASPASSATARAGRAGWSISAPSSSSMPPASRPRTCPIAARRRRSPTFWPATCRS